MFIMNLSIFNGGKTNDKMLYLVMFVNVFKEGVCQYNLKFPGELLNVSYFVL